MLRKAGYQPKPKVEKAKVDNPYQGVEYFGYPKKRI